MPALPEPPKLELSRAAVLAIMRALIEDELKALRPTRLLSLQAEGADWDEQTPLEVDSMEHLALATRLADFFQVRVTGLEDYLLAYKTLGQWADLILEARQRGAQDLTFLTSGSSGQPKASTHAWPQLVTEAAFFKQLLSPLEGAAAAPKKRFLVLLPCHHLYGLIFSILLPELMRLPRVSGIQAFSQVQGRQLQAGDVILGFPFVWKQLSRAGQAFPAGVLGITSTAPSDPLVTQALADQGLEQLLEVYGASETGGLGYRWLLPAKHPTTPPPFRLLPRWIKDPSNHQSILDPTDPQPLALPDALTWVDGAHFFVQGRLDGGVQVGGINVFPDTLAKALEALPQVKAARLRLMRNDEGDRLKAFIVPTDPQMNPTQLAALEKQLTDWCEAHWRSVEIPRAFTFGAALPVTAMGKACDWSLLTGLSSEGPLL